MDDDEEEEDASPPWLSESILVTAASCDDFRVDDADVMVASDMVDRMM